MRKVLTCLLTTVAVAMSALSVASPVDRGTALKFGVGMFQPDREKNEATYRPLAEYLSAKLNRRVELRTVDSWEGLAKSLANGETDNQENIFGVVV